MSGVLKLGVAPFDLLPPGPNAISLLWLVFTFGPPDFDSFRCPLSNWIPVFLNSSLFFSPAASQPCRAHLLKPSKYPLGNWLVASSCFI